MKTIIYVKPNFQQQQTDEILFVCPTFVEIQTQDIKKHKDYIFDISKEEVYQIKLDDCISKRALAYEQLNQKELMFDDMVNGTKLWIEAIQEIKNKYPKPSPNLQGLREQANPNRVRKSQLLEEDKPIIEEN